MHQTELEETIELVIGILKESKSDLLRIMKKEETEKKLGIVHFSPEQIHDVHESTFRNLRSNINNYCTSTLSYVQKMVKP